MARSDTRSLCKSYVAQRVMPRATHQVATSCCDTLPKAEGNLFGSVPEQQTGSKSGFKKTRRSHADRRRGIFFIITIWDRSRDLRRRRGHLLIEEGDLLHHHDLGSKSGSKKTQRSRADRRRGIFCIITIWGRSRDPRRRRGHVLIEEGGSFSSSRSGIEVGI